MKKKYFTFFEIFFFGLRMTRPEYKEQAQHLLRAVREAKLGPEMEAECVAFEAVIDSFDENLTERQAPTEGETEDYHRKRQEWLDFVDDTMKDFVTPKLRKLPVYDDFKPFGKAKLSALKQDKFITNSQGLIKLYLANQKTMGYPTLGADAQKKLDAVTGIDATRDTHDATLDTTILDLGTDWKAIALAERRIKARLELLFDDPKKVYSFFDFSKAAVNKSGKVKVITGTTPA